MPNGCPMAVAKLHIGTSGWSYQHWYGHFYPESLKPTNFLEYYATQFHCVELNASFYHTPLPKVVAKWRQCTPDNFYFCVKVSRYITHRLRLEQVTAALSKFMEIFAPLAPKLGPFLIQLPPSLQYDPARAEQFFLLLQQFSAYRFALEPRHVSWFQPESLLLMRRYKICAVMADSGGTFPENWETTTDFVYLRFHGAHGLYYSPYSPQELQTFARRIRQWLSEQLDVWAFFNNDAQAHAVCNARELGELVG